MQYAQIVASYKSCQHMKAEEQGTLCVEAEQIRNSPSHSARDRSRARSAPSSLLQPADNLVFQYATSNAKQQRCKSSPALMWCVPTSGVLYKLASTETGVTPPGLVVAVL